MSGKELDLESYEIYFNSEVLWYEVTMVTQSELGIENVTETIRYDVLRDCSLNKVQLMFLNPLGAWETFMFTGANNKSIDTSQTRFDKASVPVYDETRFKSSIVESNLVNTQTLNSRYLKVEELEWLKGLIQSPYIYILSSDDTLLPVLVSNIAYNYNSIDELYTLNLDIDYSYEQKSIKG